MGCAFPLGLAENGLVSGTVQASDGDAVLVCGKAGLIRAVRAEGCLLSPEAGDRVLVALLGSGEAWVLSVLRRQGGEAELRLPEHVAICGQNLDIRAGRACLAAPSLTLRGDDLRMEGKCVDLRSGLLTLGGNVLLQGFAVVQTLARRLGEQVLRRTGRYQSLLENVDELAERKAGRIRTDSRTSYRVRSENTDIRARGQIDLDAEHIKVG